MARAKYTNDPAKTNISKTLCSFMFGARENRQILLFEIKQKITAEAKEEDITQFNNTIIKCVIMRGKKL